MNPDETPHDVTRIHTKTGSHIEPPLDPSWDDLTQLQWLAAVVSHDTGHTVTVHPARYWIDEVPQYGYYEIRVTGSTSGGPHTYSGAWSWLSGFESGVRAERGGIDK